MRGFFRNIEGLFEVGDYKFRVVLIYLMVWFFFVVFYSFRVERKGCELDDRIFNEWVEDSKEGVKV